MTLILICCSLYPFTGVQPWGTIPETKYQIPNESYSFNPYENNEILKMSIHMNIQPIGITPLWSHPKLTIYWNPGEQIKIKKLNKLKKKYENGNGRKAWNMGS